jgi:hypothetical protein
MRPVVSLNYVIMQQNLHSFVSNYRINEKPDSHPSTSLLPSRGTWHASGMTTVKLQTKRNSPAESWLL